MRRLPLVLTLALAAVAVVSAVCAAPARASCAAVIVWHDAPYFAYATSGPRPHPVPDGPVAGAVAPGCNDTGGGPVSPTSVGARSIAGVPPRVALLSSGELYVPVGEFPQTPPFPVRFARVDDETRTCRVTSRMTLSGRAEPSVWGVVLAHGKSVFVDVHTRFTGLARDGVPFVGWHQAVRIDAVRCGGEIVATRVVRVGPQAAAATAEETLGASWRGGPGILSDRTTLEAVLIVGAGALLVLGLRAGRRPPAAHRG